MKRSTRHIALVTLLQSRKFVPIDDIVKRFSVSERTAYRDLAALQEAGIPIGCEPGHGYFLPPGFLLPPIMFSIEEAMALASARFFLKEWASTSTGSSYLSAFDKIRAVLRQEEKEFIDSLDRQMTYIQWPDLRPVKPDPDIFIFLQYAIVRHHVITITYLSGDRKESKRDIEPLGLIMIGGHWYIAAWCRLRNAYRMFRTDRVLSYSNTMVTFSSKNGHTLEAFYKTAEPKENAFIQIRLFVPNHLLTKLDASKQFYGWQSEIKVKGGTEMLFSTLSPDSFSRWVIGWGGSVRVIEPASVATLVHNLAVSIDKYFKK